MKKTITLMTAPTSMQPGGYVPKAYADHTSAITPQATIEIIHSNEVTKIVLEWENKHPVKTINGEITTFVDSAAILAPKQKDAPWITMGAPSNPIDGALWRADKSQLIHINAAGLGSVKRSEPPAEWLAAANWKDNTWRVEFSLPNWTHLKDTQQLAIAIWSGHHAERGGLKSVSQGWLALD